MKTHTIRSIAFISLFTVLSQSSFSQLAIPSDGSDGALNVTSNIVIDLSQAVTGVWSNNNSANVGKGIYDPNKWAVVFKYSSVNIASNSTVSFKNHPTHAPVVWLVKTNVVINGEVGLDGQNSLNDTVNLAEPGPGGFRGGAQGQAALGHGGGFGPGGYWNDNGAYSTYHSYGNPQIIPLIGGSGGSAGFNGYDNGAAGGGAILIAVSGTLTVNGYCHANGGYISRGSIDFAYPGSGGAIRLVADQILGAGRVEATSSGYPGRVRLEANSASTALSLNPPTIAVLPSPLVIWPDTNAPIVKVISVAGQSAPLDPKAALSASGDDLTIANSSAVTILLQTSNFPTNGTVNVYVKPRNDSQSILPATYVSGTTNLANWQLVTTLPVSHCVIQARAISN